MTKAQINNFFATLETENPEPKVELKWINTFTLLVAVILSAQATDVSVNKATRRLFLIADTPEKMLALGEIELKKHIKHIGLFNTKAKNIITICRQLVKNNNGKLIGDRRWLETLPGVGRKTANVVLNIAFRKPTIAVDTHIFRVANRTGLAIGKTPLTVERALLRNVPITFQLKAHRWLVLHGRYVCKKRVPNCPSCKVSLFCNFREKTLPA
ncbi:endonuclease III [Candidatus Endolissoclinum faulkneri L2]|uniref:Endonuclease III n=1 Tax=Candidatus Endolissoclinum faulkneri L2 TaxID=1193729 RepID=K7Z3Q4_9PROT|nr:endonuclease III [Candidatus Endolissoclinum faulkneri L2]